jgi:hypothetical protein
MLVGNFDGLVVEILLAVQANHCDLRKRAIFFPSSGGEEQGGGREAGTTSRAAEILEASIAVQRY